MEKWELQYTPTVIEVSAIVHLKNRNKFPRGVTEPLCDTNIAYGNITWHALI